MKRIGQERGVKVGSIAKRDGTAGGYGKDLILNLDQKERNKRILANIEAEREFIFEETKRIQEQFRKEMKSNKQNDLKSEESFTPDPE